MTLSRPFLEGIRIIVVEDKGDFLSAAKNAIEGLRLVREICPDVVLSDINMPGRNGIELLADIRALGRNDGGSVPVIAMTAYMVDQTLVDAGFQSILRKPFEADQLFATIDAVLSGRPPGD